MAGANATASSQDDAFKSAHAHVASTTVNVATASAVAAVVHNSGLGLKFQVLRMIEIFFCRNVCRK